MQLSKTTLKTPVGDLTAIASEHGLVALSYLPETACVSAYIQPIYPKPAFGTKFRQNLDITRIWLAEYFKSNFEGLIYPAFDLYGNQLAVAAWKKLLSIPSGKTQSYSELAKTLGKPNAARAIGRIMSQNPIAILLPCHRVIGANGTLTGYGGGLERKIWLLRHEGVLGVT